MKRITFARLAVLLLAAGALALSGCGGDDNGVDQSLLDTVMDDLDAETMRADDAEELAATETMRADDAEELAAAETMRADDAEGMSGEGQDAIDAAMQADMNTRAPLIIAAMAEMDDGRDTADPTVKVSHGDMGFKAEAQVGYVLMPDMVPPMIEGWQGATLTRDKIPPAGTDAVYVYSDIDMATGMPFATAYGDPYRITKEGKAMSDRFPDKSDPTASLQVDETWGGFLRRCGGCV